MKLLSINTSLIKEKMYLNKPVKTGILKTPVKGSVKVYSDHIEGDQQADLIHHGGTYKAVYGVSNHHYPYWEKRLGIDKISPGYYGENLTFDYLKEEDLCIGDQIQIGDVILSISQPRSPCYKVSIASENKMNPKMFIESERSGIYFKVLQEGTINTDSTITLTPYSGIRITVKELFTATFGPENDSTLKTIQEAFNHPELAPAWKRMVEPNID